MPQLPPAILLGGNSGTALSVARGLGRRGVDVYLLGTPGPQERHSRFVRPVRLRGQDGEQAEWADFLIGPASRGLRGAVVLACSDAGLEFILAHAHELADRYLLDSSDPVTQEAFLNKLSTYRLAEDAGVATPRFWEARTLDQVRAHEGEYVYPLIVKPLFSHKFTKVFGRKFLVAHDAERLVEACREVLRHELEAVLLEWIAGPDDRLCSYYTYMDENGEPLYHFTKRILRRYPTNEGLACHHVTDWDPEVRDLGLALLRHAGHRGLANVEFKRDDRDGMLKVIECNARFTAGNALVAASGYDLGPFVYNRIVGIPQAPLIEAPYRRGLHLWDPGRDFMAFLELRQTQGLRLGEWVRSLMHPMVFRYFCWDDPVPAVASLLGLHTRAARFGRRRAGAPRSLDQRPVEVGVDD